VPVLGLLALVSRTPAGLFAFATGHLRDPVSGGKRCYGLGNQPISPSWPEWTPLEVASQRRPCHPGCPSL
jgi:hypothetical protein